MNYWIFVPIVFVTLFLSACTATESVVTPPAQEKQGMTSKTGVVVQDGNTFLLQEVGSPPVVVDSYSVDLSLYVGQSITVSGQYSGDTLFVGEVQ